MVEGDNAATARPRGAPPPGQRTLVESPTALAIVAERLAGADTIGVDLETGTPPREGRHRFALLQLAVAGQAWAIDPLRLPDLSALAPVFANPDVIKAFVAVGGDAPFLEAAGLSLRGVCDVAEVGRSAFGRRGEGLQSLVERAFGVVMDKSLQRSDWLRRPLTTPLLAYAYRDAELTLALYRWFREGEPVLTRLHTTLLARPELPTDLPDWLRAVLEGRRGGDRRLPADKIVEEMGRDPVADAPTFLAGCQDALTTMTDVRSRVRLLDAIGELDLFELAPALVAELRTPSASLRFSAARALGRLADPETIEALTAARRDDAVQDVREAADRALRAIAEQEQERQAQEEAAGDDGGGAAE